MSDIPTPRTDAFMASISGRCDDWSWFAERVENFARQLERELAELTTWKESALNTFPPFQEIGRELWLKLGTNISSQILPGIVGPKRELAEANQKIGIWQTQVAEAIRQVEASDNLNRELMAKLRELSRK